jgi:uncharacterized Zn-finger protein
MAETAEIIHTESAQVSCDGGGGALGHPRVYLQIKLEVGEIECPYCSRRYVLKQDSQPNAETH